MALDGLDEPDVEREYAARRRPEMELGFASSGLVPTELPSAERTLIYQSLTAEMRLAASAADATYRAAGLHIPSEPSDQIGFRTRLDPGPLTDMVSSACVVAALEVLKGAAALFDWTVDLQEVDRLLAEARQLNEESATAKLSRDAANKRARPLTASMPSQRTRDAYDSWSRPNGSPVVALNRHCPPRLAPSTWLPLCPMPRFRATTSPRQHTPPRPARSCL